MSLPPLASVPALEARLGVTLTGVDAARAEAALDDASALIRDTAGKSWSTDGTTLDADVPGVVVTITLAAARRAYDNPSGLISETIGNYSYSRDRGGDGRSGVYLTADEARLIRRTVGSRTFDSLELVRQSGTGTLWVSTQDQYADLVPFETDPLT